MELRGVIANRMRASVAGLLAMAFVGCSLQSSGELLGDGDTSFLGVTALSPQGDGTWVLSWNAVSSGMQPFYRIYQRALSAQYDASAPIATTTLLSYTTANLTGKESQCFMVRTLSDGVTEGVQTPEKCTDASKTAMVFDGLRTLSLNKDGSSTLVWAKLASEQISYHVYLRNAKTAIDFKSPAWTTQDTTFKAPAPPFGEQYCYVVRYTGIGLIPDENAKESCTATESLGEFTGIAVATSPADGTVELNWSVSNHANVKEYRIYRDAKFQTLVNKTSKDVNSYRITGLTSGELVRFGVRVVDRLGREDANTKTIAVRVACSNGCNTPPETPDAPTLQLMPPGASGSAAICSSTYKDVDADGTKVRASFQFFNLKNPALPRATVNVDPGVKTALYLLKTTHDVLASNDADARGDMVFCRVSVTDGIASVESSPSIGPITLANAPPIIGNSETKTVREGASLAFNLNAWDPDGDGLNVACTAGCGGGASFNSGTGDFSWTPSYGAAGNYELIFSATDGIATTSQTIRIVVTHTNRVPVFAETTPKSVEKNSLLSFTLHADDPDGSTIAYACSENCPAGLAVNPTSGLVQWTPTGSQLGTFRPVFIASDGEGNGVMGLTLSVRDVNQAPVFGVIPNQNVNEMQALSFVLAATDPDGDTVAYRCLNACPSGLTANQVSGVVGWTPSYAQSGSYPVTFEATDGQKTATKEIVITVNNVNRAPFAVASLSAPNPAYNDNSLSCSSLGTSDPDSEDVGNLTITYKWYADNVEISGENGTQLVMHGLGGLYNGTALRCEVVVTDGKVVSPVTARSAAATIQNRAPTAHAVISPPNPVLSSTLTCDVSTSTDPDGDSLSYFYVWRIDGNVISGQNAATLPASQTGTQSSYSCAVTANDGHSGTSAANSAAVLISNRAPILSTILAQSISEGATLSLNLSATDPDGDTLAYRCSANCPTGLTVNSSTGAVSWPVAYGQNGSYSVSFEASDGMSPTTQNVAITVNRVNRAPVAAATLIAPSTLYNNATLGCSSVGTTDPDAEDVAYVSSHLTYKWLANGSYIAGATAASYTLPGTGGLYVEQTISCEVGATDGYVASPVTAVSTGKLVTNRGPTVSASVTPAVPTQGSTLTCDTSSSIDPDGDSLSYTYVWKKDNVVLAGQTSSTLSSPNLVHYSSYLCIANGDDGHGATSSATATAVSIANRAPTFSAISSQTTNEAVTLSFSLSATDPDGDSVTYRCSANCPTGLTVNASTGAVSWPVTYGQYGSYTVTFESTDGTSPSTQNASITVNKINRPPVPVAILIAPSTLYNDGTLGCSSAGTADPDDEDVAYVSSHITFKWLANGAHIPGATSSSYTLPGVGGLYVGQSISCEVSATDGHIASPVAAVSSGKLVSNRSPVVSALLSPVSPTQADTLTCSTAGSTDSDGDTLNFGYVWKKDNVVISGQTAATLPSSQLVHFSNYLCEATGDDGHGGVTTVGSTPVTVQNRVPTIALVSGNATTQDVPAGGAITNILLGSSDVDGDAVTFERTAGSTECPNLVIDTATGVISGRVQRVDETPARSVLCTARFRSKDPYDAYSVDVVVTVYSTNRAPTISCTNQSGDYGTTNHSTACTSSDPDLGTAATYSTVSSCGIGVSAAGALTGIMPATTCTSSVIMSDGTLSNTANITLTPNISLTMNSAGAIDDQCNYTIPGAASYTAGASYSSASGTISCGTVTSANATGLSGVLSNPAAGTFNVGWTVDSSGVVSSSTLNKTMTLAGSSIAGTSLKQMLGANTAATSTVSGLEAPKQGCGSYCSGTRAGIFGSEGTVTLCGLTPSGGVACWGNNTNQQAGFPLAFNTPQLIPGISTATKIAVGGSGSACALLADQSVKCWGFNGSGQLGNASAVDSIAPVVAAGVTAATEIVAGDTFVCALDAGTPKCWGDNSVGQIGQALGATYTSPTAVTKTGGTTLTGMTMLASSTNASCAANATEVWCWGNNVNGQLGDGTNITRKQAVQVVDTSNAPFSSAAGISSIVTSDYVSCASSLGGQAWCWGTTSQIGDGSATASWKAKQVLDSSGVNLTGVSRLLAAGTGKTFAKMTDNSVKAWGSGLAGWKADGNSLSTAALSPTAITGFNGGTAITDLSTKSGPLICAVQTDQTPKCWGDNNYGQLGTGDVAGSNYVPMAISGLPAVTNISASNTYQNVCAVTPTGSVYCWGRGTRNNFGVATIQLNTPYTIPGVTGVTHLAFGANALSTYALKSDGTVITWGGGNYLSNRFVTPFAGVSDATSLVAIKSPSFTALCYTDSTANANVRCWGTNASGQLGNGTTTASLTTPVLVSLGLAAGEKAIGLATAELSVCALISPTNVVKCWGKNDYGQVGLTPGTPAYQATPVQVAGLSNVVALTGGFLHFCALIADGSVKCWGQNTHKELGDGTTTNNPAPVTAMGVSNAVALSSNGDINGSWTCAVISDRSLKCWGSNNGYGLGDGTATDGPLVTVLNLSDGVVAVGGGSHSICALTGLGNLMCWGGFGLQGVYGNNDLTSNRKLPTSPVLGSFGAWSSCNKLTISP